MLVSGVCELTNQSRLGVQEGRGGALKGQELKQKPKNVSPPTRNHQATTPRERLSIIWLNVLSALWQLGILILAERSSKSRDFL